MPFLPQTHFSRAAAGAVLFGGGGEEGEGRGAMIGEEGVVTRNSEQQQLGFGVVRSLFFLEPLSPVSNVFSSSFPVSNRLAGAAGHSYFVAVR